MIRYLLAAITLLAILWRLDHVSGELDAAKDKLKTATQALAASEASRTTERARQTVADTEGARGHGEIEQARRDAAGANAAAFRLRAEASRLATSLATCNAATAAERQARASASYMLADVLGRADERAGELAAIADRARAAGVTCERVYDGVMSANKAGQEMH